jgi:hypothetical protein
LAPTQKIRWRICISAAPAALDPYLEVRRLPDHSSHSFPLLSRDKRAKVRLMGHNKGRDNAKKRAKRRKKNDRLALAKKKQKSSNTREREPRG